MSDALPPGAVTAALHSLHDTGCKCGGEYHPPPASDLERLNIALTAAAPAIREQAIRTATAEQYGQAIRDAAREAAGPMIREITDRVMDDRLAVTEALVRASERQRLRESAGSGESLGQLVRETWIEWAQEQPDPKPSWLTPWDDLDEGQREVDTRIGATVAAVARAAEVSARVAEQESVHADLALLLRTLGMFDGARPESSHEVMLEAIAEAGRLRQSAEAIRAGERERLLAGGSTRMLLLAGRHLDSEEGVMRAGHVLRVPVGADPSSPTDRCQAATLGVDLRAHEFAPETSCDCTGTADAYLRRSASRGRAYGRAGRPRRIRGRWRAPCRHQPP